MSHYGEVDYNDFTRKEKVKKQDKSVSCVYELLNEGQSCKWNNDGTIVLNRPTSSSLLNKIKFRSFSANIRSDITNTNIPDLTFDLCARFIHLNKPDAIYRMLKTSTSEDNRLYIGNSSGEYIYSGANSQYNNDVGNEIIIDSSKINLSNGIEAAYESAAKYSNKQMKSLLGLTTKEDDSSYYAYNTFSTQSKFKYKYLSGVNGICCGFDAENQTPLWFNEETGAQEARGIKDYFNLCGHPNVNSITESGTMAGNDYQPLTLVLDTGKSVSLSIGTTEYLIDIALSQNVNTNNLDRYVVLYSSSKFSSFEERKKYNPKATYVIKIFNGQGSLLSKTITSQLKAIYEKCNFTGDCYFAPMFYASYINETTKSDYSNLLIIYLIGPGTTPIAALCYSSTGGVDNYKTIYFSDYFAPTMDIFPYYGTDFWWLFLSQHFYNFRTAITTSKTDIYLNCSLLPHKDVYRDYVWLYDFFKINIDDLEPSEHIHIDSYNSTPTPLLYIASKITNPDIIFLCRYSTEDTNTQYYSYSCPHDVDIGDLFNYCSPDAPESYNVYSLTFGDNNVFSYNFGDWLFDGSFYYRYSNYSPFYTLTDSKIYYSAGGVQYETYTKQIITSGVEWFSSPHTDDYQYRIIFAADKLANFFKYDRDSNTMTTIRIPVWNDPTNDYGVIEFYMRFYTNPLSYYIDITNKSLPISMNAYYDCYQQSQEINGIFVETYNIADIIRIIDETYYAKVLLFVELSNSDQTLKLVCDNYPTLNNIVFYLNETSMVDFKESDANPAEPNIKCKIIDANDEIITPKNAKALYSNITICLDWEFDN